MVYLKEFWKRGLAVCSASALVIACSGKGDDELGGGDSPTEGTLDVGTERLALNALSAKGTQVFGGGAEPTKLSGKGLGKGSTPRLAAEDFVKRNRAALRLTDDDEAGSPPPDSRTPSEVPVLFDPATGKYRFTRISYGQVRDGVPVYGARVDAL